MKYNVPSGLMVNKFDLGTPSAGFQKIDMSRIKPVSASELTGISTSVRPIDNSDWNNIKNIKVPNTSNSSSGMSSGLQAGLGAAAGFGTSIGQSDEHPKWFI